MKSQLQKMVDNGKIPMYVCFDPNTRDIVYIWEESPDRLQYRTEIDGEWVSISNTLIRYRFSDQGFWLNNTQRTIIFKAAQEMMKGCTKKNKLMGEYLIEKVCPIKYWIELQDRINKEIK